MSEAVQPPNIKYTGALLDYSGYGSAAREFVRALYEAEVNIITQRLTHVEDTTNFGTSGDIVEKLQGNDIDYKIKILHITADLYLKHLEQYKYHIGHLFWETDKLHPLWVWSANRLDEIWTGSEWNKEVFQKSGVKIPIYVFPQPVETNPPEVKPFILPNHKGLLFYSIFQWIERKNPKALLESYWREFEGHDDVSLLLKTYHLNFTPADKALIYKDIAHWKEQLKLKAYPRVYIYDGLLEESDMWRLHATGEVFVSAHRGEGFGRPQAEAMAMAHPVISTDLGGIHTFIASDKYALPVKYTMTPVFNMNEMAFYSDDMNWAEVDIDDLRSKLGWVYNNRDKAKETGRNGQELAKKLFSYHAVGTALRRRLEDIEKTIA